MSMRMLHLGRREMRREGVGQAEHGGELRAIGRWSRGSTPRRPGPSPGTARTLLARLGRLEIAHQFDDVLRETVDAGIEVAAQRPRGHHVGAGRAAEPEIDAAGMKRRQRAELLGDDQRRVVGQHDAARADANGRGAGRDMGDHHRGRRTRDARHVVMLGEPVAVVAEALGMARQIERVLQRLGDIAAFGNRREIEYGKGGHGALPGIEFPI